MTERKRWNDTMYCTNGRVKEEEDDYKMAHRRVRKGLE